MFSFSPKQDLILLSFKHNFPHLEWNDVSRQIYQNYDIYIPSDLCASRYSTLQKYINSNYFYQMDDQYIGVGVDSFKSQFKDIRTPQSFSFLYSQFKKIEEEEMNQHFKIMQMEQRVIRIIQKLVYGDFQNVKICQDFKLYKDSRRWGKVQSQVQKMSLLKSLLSYVNKNKYQMLLTEEIIQIKIDDLLLQIGFEANKLFNSSSNYQIVEFIHNPKQVVKLIRKNGLFEQMRVILYKGFINCLEQDENLLIVGRIFNQINLEFNYKSKIEVKTVKQQMYENKNNIDEKMDDKHKSHSRQEKLQIDAVLNFNYNNQAQIKREQVIKQQSSDSTTCQTITSCDKNWKFPHFEDLEPISEVSEPNASHSEAQIKIEEPKLQLKIQDKINRENITTRVLRKRKQKIKSPIGKVWIDLH